MIVGILTFVLTFCVSLVLSELFGYVYHRLAHRPGTALYRSHMKHHLEAYPPSDFLSETEYRSVGSASFTWWFVPLFLGFVGIQFLVLPFWLFLGGLAATSFSAIMNNRVHDAVHVNSRSSRRRWFRAARARHRVHHRNMRKNFGIWCFWFDRLFKTLR